MKILYLITKSEAGGAQTHVADLCRYFVSKGNEIAVMSRGGGWLENECKKIGVNFVINEYFSNSANPLNIFRAIKKIRKYCADFKPDIVHCHSSAAAFLGRLAIKGKIRTIYTAHGWGFNVGMNPIIRYAVLIAEKITAKYTDKYICVSEFVKNLALKYNLAPADKFVVIYNGVAPRIVSTDAGQKTGNRLIFVGRLAEPKKPEFIIEAMGRLPDEMKDNIKLVIVGDGPKRKVSENLARANNVKVEFKGAVSRGETLREMELADIFVFASAWEGFPYTILEAMSCGLPVIASDVGGISEVLNEQNGILIKNDIQQIKGVIINLVSNKEMRYSLGQKGRFLIEQKYSLDKMLGSMEKEYFKFESK